MATDLPDDPKLLFHCDCYSSTSFHWTQTLSSQVVVRRTFEICLTACWHDAAYISEKYVLFDTLLQPQILIMQFILMTIHLFWILINAWFSL